MSLHWSQNILGGCQGVENPLTVGRGGLAPRPSRDATRRALP